jgi:Uncharacterized conserved protein
MGIEREILQILHFHSLLSRSEIALLMNDAPQERTLKRQIALLVEKGYVIVCGKGPSTKYSLSPQAHVTMPIDLNTYFLSDIDEREIQKNFNFDLIKDILPNVVLFSESDMAELNEAQKIYKRNSEGMSRFEYDKEMSRLGIDLSWKSSQIEGNTYSLLETERLLNEKKTANGKTKEEAIMLLNHKDALQFIIDNSDYLRTISVKAIEEIHSLLVKELGVNNGIRYRRVGITGTNYRPLDNEFQIREALEDTCTLINAKDNVWEKALLALVLLSYIQAFTDGNKRTARVVSNAILIAYGYCPISFRTVDSIDYKKAMLIFYEQNNISAFRSIFIEQFKFAVEQYF